MEDETGQPIRLNSKNAGGSGRRKLHWTDWDGDGLLDLLMDSKNVELHHGVGWNQRAYILKSRGDLATLTLAGHDTSPTTVDWEHDGVRDLLVGAEDGCFYFMPREPAPPR
jgi:hypothetical protein